MTTRLDEIINEGNIKRLLEEGHSCEEVLSLLNAAVDETFHSRVDEQNLKKKIGKALLPKGKRKEKKPTKAQKAVKAARAKARHQGLTPDRLARAGKSKPPSTNKFKITPENSKLPMTRAGIRDLKRLARSTSAVKNFSKKAAYKLRAVAKLINIAMRKNRGKPFRQWDPFAQFIFKAFVIGGAMQAKIPTGLFGKGSKFYGRSPSIWEFIQDKDVNGGQKIDEEGHWATCPADFDAEEIYSDIEDIEYLPRSEGSTIKESLLREQKFKDPAVPHDPRQPLPQDGARRKPLKKKNPFKANPGAPDPAQPPSKLSPDELMGNLQDKWFGMIGHFFPRLAKGLQSGPAIMGPLTFVFAVACLIRFVPGMIRAGRDIPVAFSYGLSDCSAMSWQRRAQAIQRAQHGRPGRKEKPKGAVGKTKYILGLGAKAGKAVYGTASWVIAFPVELAGKLQGNPRAAPGQSKLQKFWARGLGVQVVGSKINQMFLALFYGLGSTSCKFFTKHHPRGAAKHGLRTQLRQLDDIVRAANKIAGSSGGKILVDTPKRLKKLIKKDIATNRAMLEGVENTIRSVCKRRGDRQGALTTADLEGLDLGQSGQLGLQGIGRSNKIGLVPSASKLFGNLEGSLLPKIVTEVGGPEAFAKILAGAVMRVGDGGEKLCGFRGRAVILFLIFLAAERCLSIIWKWKFGKDEEGKKISFEDAAKQATGIADAERQKIKFDQESLEAIQAENERLKQQLEIRRRAGRPVESVQRKIAKRNSSVQARQAMIQKYVRAIPGAIKDWDKLQKAGGDALPKECFKDSPSFNAEKCCKNHYADLYGDKITYEDGCCKYELEIIKFGPHGVGTPIVEKIGDHVQDAFHNSKEKWRACRPAIHSDAYYNNLRDSFWKAISFRANKK